MYSHSPVFSVGDETEAEDNEQGLPLSSGTFFSHCGLNGGCNRHCSRGEGDLRGRVTGEGAICELGWEEVGEAEL